MRKLLIPFTVCVYLMQAAFIALLVVAGAVEEMPLAAYIPFFVFGFAALVLGCLCIVFGFLQIAKPQKSCYKLVMIIKLSLVPFFVINLILCLLLALGFLFMPLFLGLGVIIVGLCLLVTYLIVFVTSSFNIGYTIQRVRSGETTLWEVLVPTIFQFFFVLDCVGSVMFYVGEKNAAPVI